VTEGTSDDRVVAASIDGDHLVMTVKWTMGLCLMLGGASFLEKRKGIQKSEGNRGWLVSKFMVVIEVARLSIERLGSETSLGWC
jgi:hypothetical protein